MERFLTVLPIHNTSNGAYLENSEYSTNTNGITDSIGYSELFLLNSATHTITFEDIPSDTNNPTLTDLTSNTTMITTSNQLVARGRASANVHYFNMLPSFYYFFKPFEYLTNTTVMNNTLDVSSFANTNISINLEPNQKN